MLASEVIEYKLITIKRVKLHEIFISYGFLIVFLVDIVVFYKPYCLFYTKLLLLIYLAQVKANHVVALNLLILDIFK